MVVERVLAGFRSYLPATTEHLVGKGIIEDSKVLNKGFTRTDEVQVDSEFIPDNGMSFPQNPHFPSHTL